MLPALGSIKLQDLQPVQVQALLGKLLDHGGARGEGIAASTVRRCRGLFSQAMLHASKQGLVMRNVVELVDAPRARRPELTTWTAAQVVHFLEVASTFGYRHGYGPVWHLAALTGMRRGEILGVGRGPSTCPVDERGATPI
jgi:hypothetical protein